MTSTQSKLEEKVASNKKTSKISGAKCKMQIAPAYKWEGLIGWTISLL